MNNKINTVSSEAVEKATGKSWDEWIKIIQQSAVADQSHKEIARWLAEDQKVKPWWSQMVTVGYEYATGRRVVGETADQGFEVGVHKTLPIDRAELWEFILSRQGLRLWLGGINELVLERKQLYKTAEGTAGEVRTFKEAEMIRMTWQPKNRKSPTTLQIRLDSTGPDKTRLAFHHEKLTDSKEREAMRKHWQTIAGKLAAALK